MPYNVVIICSANMCRSPMAAGYLQKRAAELNLDMLDVQGAALYYDGGMMATEGARQTAMKNGFSLDSHRSRYLDDAMYAWADEILVMTKSHRKDLLMRFPESAENKVFLLGAFDPEVSEKTGAEAEIRDPYGSAFSTYETVFEQIKRSLEGWLKARDKVLQKTD